MRKLAETEYFLNREKIFILFSTSLLPVSTALGLAWLMTQHAAGLGYVLPLIAAGICIFYLVFSLLVGLLSGQLKQCLLGYFLGLAVSLAMLAGLMFSEKASAEYRSVTVKNEMKVLLPAIHQGVTSVISQELSRLKKVSVPTAVCILTSTDGTGGNGFYISDDPQKQLQGDAYFSVAQLLQVLKAVDALTISVSQKTAAFYMVLTVIPSRGNLADFETWLTLWDHAGLSGSEHFIRIVEPFVYEDAGFCASGDSPSLVSWVTESWGEQALLTWLKTGHLFAPEQQRNVLKAVKTAPTLEKLVQSGVDVNAADPKSSEGGFAARSFFYTRAQSLYRDINESADPSQVVLLVETFVKYHVDIKSKMTGDKTACEEFSETGQYIDEKNASVVKVQNRKKAFRAIQKILCDSSG